MKPELKMVKRYSCTCIDEIVARSPCVEIHHNLNFTETSAQSILELQTR